MAADGQKATGISSGADTEFLVKGRIVENKER
jgi:hypothetical protein